LRYEHHKGNRPHLHGESRHIGYGIVSTQSNPQLYVLFLGANQVILNLIIGRVFDSNVVVLAPKLGAFAARFVESGAAVRVGEQGQLSACLRDIRDVVLVICNTLMAAPQVLEMCLRPQPCIFIIHEWYVRAYPMQCITD
jgi:hypothetical protein